VSSEPESMAAWRELFSAIRQGRGSDAIALQIQEAVLSGRLAVGDRLPNERELGMLFGVSRSTLREAIRMLEAAGVVEVRRGTTGGTFVAEPKADRAGLALAALIRFRGATAEDFSEFRESFEPLTAFWAARRATPEERATLSALADQVAREAERRSPWSQFIDRDLAFHLQLAVLSHNQIRLAIMLAIHEVFRRSSLAIAPFDTPEWRRRQAEELSAVAEAVARRHPGEAKRLMQHHVRQNAQAVREVLSAGALVSRSRKDDAAP
jgi:GntR family transcriptional repressor for pyruvate dehydrogenase complex